MAAILKGGLTKDDPKLEGGAPTGPMERFHLGRSNRVVQLKNKPYAVPVIINGHADYAEMGAYNEMQKEYVDVLEQSASTAVEVPMGDGRNPSVRGIGDRIPNSTMQVEYLGDFEILRDHKKVDDVRETQTITVPGGIHARKYQRGPKKFQPVLSDEPAPSVSGEAPKED
jgi:hypothetical protein